MHVIDSNIGNNRYAVYTSRISDGNRYMYTQIIVERNKWTKKVVHFARDLVLRTKSECKRKIEIDCSNFDCPRRPVGGSRLYTDDCVWRGGDLPWILPDLSCNRSRTVTGGICETITTCLNRENKPKTTRS